MGGMLSVMVSSETTFTALLTPLRTTELELPENSFVTSGRYGPKRWSHALAPRRDFASMSKDRATTRLPSQRNGIAFHTASAAYGKKQRPCNGHAGKPANQRGAVAGVKSRRRISSTRLSAMRPSTIS